MSRPPAVAIVPALVGLALTVLALIVLTLIGLTPPALAQPAAPAVAGAPAEEAGASAARVVERYLAARGGAERWRALRALEIRGTYAAFSQRSPFTLLRKRGDLYRLDFALLGEPAVRARDAEGPWWRHTLLQPEAARVTEGPYRAQLERESHFEPLLLDADAKGVGVRSLGAGEVEGQPTVGLAVLLPGGARETWHLDAETFLEVAVDSELVDFTQAMEPIAQRTFFSDFRPVGGLVLPFRVESEFGARLEVMAVEEVVVDPDLDDARFGPPPAF